MERDTGGLRGGGYLLGLLNALHTARDSIAKSTVSWAQAQDLCSPRLLNQQINVESPVLLVLFDPGTCRSW